jgi:methylmalonyl-CoA/ethylmalonyl-CoA epimerase
MHISQVEHIAIAVKSLAEAIPLYEQILGVPCYAIEEVMDQQVKTAFFMVGQTKIELLEGLDPESPVARFIGKRGEGLHHIALAVNDVDACLKELDEKGVQLVDKTSRTGAEGLNIAFLHPKSTRGVLIELCGKKNNKSSCL